MSYPIPPRETVFQRAGDVFDYCDGPVNESISQTTRWTTRWCAWVATDGVRYGRVADGGTKTDTGGTLTTLFTAGYRPTHLSFCFDQDSRPVMAVQHDATTVLVAKFVSGTPTTFEFPGVTPLVFFDGVLVHDTPLTDVVCLYIKAAGDTIFGRLQRNDFDTEYTLNADIKTVLSKLQKVDRLHALGRDWLALYAKDTVGRPCVYTSEAYPPWPTHTETNDRSSMTIAGIVLDYQTLTSWIPPEAGRATMTVAGIICDNAIIIVWPPNQAGKSALAPAEIVYTVIVVNCIPGQEKGVSNLGIVEVVYAIVVVSTGVLTEKSKAAMGIAEIIYS